MAGAKLTVLVRNDTLEFIPEDNTLPTGWCCAFLFIVLVLGLCLNSCVVLCIVFTSLQSTCFNRLLACFTLVTGLEDLTNVLTSIVFDSSWEELLRIHEEGTVRLFCALNATSLQFTSVCQGYILVVLSYERLSSLRNYKNKMDGMKFGVGVIVAVVGSLGAASPTGLLITSYIRQRSGCSPIRVTLRISHYIIATISTIFGCFIPPFIILIIWKYIIQEIFKERRKIHVTEGNISFSGSRSQEFKMATSLHALGGLLVLFYFVSVLPGLVNVQTTQFYANYTFIESDLLFGRFEEKIPEDLKPRHGSLLDAVCVWFRYSFTVVSPLLIIFLHKDVKEECKKIFQTGKLNLTKVEPKNQRKRRIEVNASTDWKVPVLFATSEGLHLRTVTSPEASGSQVRYHIQFCDLVLEDSLKANIKQEETSSQKNLSARRRLSETKTPRFRELGQNKFLMNLPSRTSLLNRRRFKRFCPNPIQEEESQLDKS